jgi:uncharacterized protein YuzE
MAIKAEYDNQADALYISLRESAEVATTIEYGHAQSVDLDANGAAVGIEILSPHRNLQLGDVVVLHGLGNLYPEIAAAVEAAFPRTSADAVLTTTVTQQTATITASIGGTASKVDHAQVISAELTPC